MSTITTRTHAENANSSTRQGSYRIVTQIKMPKGMPGFFAEREFALLDLGDEYNPYMALRSLTTELTLVVVEPRFVVTDYKVHIDDVVEELLKIEDASQVLILLIATLRTDGPPQVNLLGPIVLNTETKLAAQVVQVESSYSVVHDVSLELKSSDRI